MVAHALLVIAVALSVQDPEAAGGIRIALGSDPVAQVARDGAPRTLAGKAQETVPAGGIVRFAAPGARLDFGPDAALGVDSSTSFTVSMEIRTTGAGFCTPLMCREGDAVHYSLVLGRKPGTISFETWSWQRDRATSDQRIDDGAWHRIEACHDAQRKALVLFVDGQLEAIVGQTGDFAGSPSPQLRLGNNIGAHQPFAGALRAVSIRAGIAREHRDSIAAWRACQVLDSDIVDAALEAWLVRHRHPQPPAAASVAEWDARKARVHGWVQDALGLSPPPYAPAATTPTDFATLQPALDLDVRDGGRLRRDGYTVTRVYWQSFEGYYTGGYLYVPSEPHAARCAVLCPHGHWQNGNRHPTVQARCITLAKHGYVVLAPDSAHVYDDPIGLSPLGLMIWNDLRGLELLRQRDDVDPRRLGCTGASGGGQQTFYLTALQTGLAAAAPAVMVCYTEEILNSSGVHCHCNFTPRLLAGTDAPMMSAAFAPAPQLFLSVTGDWTHRFPTRGFPEIEAIYRLYGAGDRVASRQWESGHDYSRPMRNTMYAFFDRWLKGEREPATELEASEAATENAETLAGLDRGDLPHDLAVVAREFRSRLAAAPMLPADVRAADANARLAALRARLAVLFLDRASVVKAPRARSLPGFEWRERAVSTFLVRSEPEIEIPVLRIGEGTAGVTVVIDTGGKGAALTRHAAWIEGRLRAGDTVLLADVRYTGDLDRGAPWRDPYGKLFGRDEGVLAVQDLRSVLDALPELGVGSPAGVTLLAFGDHGAPAVYATALDPRIDALIVPRLGPQYRVSDRAPRIVRVLRHGDLADAACLIAPRPLRLGGCGGMEPFAAVGALYAARGAGDRLALRSDILSPE